MGIPFIIPLTWTLEQALSYFQDYNDNNFHTWVSLNKHWQESLLYIKQSVSQHCCIDEEEGQRAKNKSFKKITNSNKGFEATEQGDRAKKKKKLWSHYFGKGA